MNKTITQLGQLRKIVKRMEDLPDDTELSFEFFLTALFPTVWGNINKEMRDCYMKGYLQGKKDNEN